MLLIWNIFKGSWLLQAATALFVGWAALKGNNVYQRSVGKQEGRTEVTTAVKEKSDADTKTAESVRKDVDDGKPGKPDPNRLRAISGTTRKDRPGN